MALPVRVLRLRLYPLWSAWIRGFESFSVMEMPMILEKGGPKAKSTFVKNV
jgi:hypothetical protein